MNTDKDTTATKPVKKRRWKVVLLTIAALIIVIRLILPYVILKYVNKTLAGIAGYYGHVEDIDLSLIRGAYKINDLRLVKVDTVTHKQDTIPFFTTPNIDLSVEWNAIFKGKIVGEIEVESPVLNFVKDKHENENVEQDTTDFREVIKKLMPLTINRFEINNGEIHFKDPYSNPVIDIAMEKIHVKAENFSNVNDSNTVLPSSIVAEGNVYKGTFNLNIKLNVLEKQPTFDLNGGISNLDMVNLNPFFKKYAKFEVEKGNFGLYTEFAAKDGAFNGYVKPLIKDLEVAKEGKFTQILWQNVVQGAANLLENYKSDKVATKLPIEGRFENPDTGLWTAISYVLRNAFVFALQPSVDNEIDIGKVESVEGKKTFLQKVFGKKEEDKNKENKTDKKNGKDKE